MPGLKGALAVRVNDGVTDRIVSRYCRGLKFTKVAPGGHRDLSFTMVLPRNLFPGLGPDDRAYVYDVRTGRPIFDAYLENPTPTDGPGGQQYDVQAMGGMALANDESRPLIYITGDISSFGQGGTFNSGNVGPGPVGTGLRIQYPSGNTVPNAVYIGATTLLFTYAVMNIGAFRVEDYSGKVDANYSLNYNIGATFAAIGDTTPRMTTTHVVDTKWVGTDFAAGSALMFYLFRTGIGTNVADDTTWSQFDGLSMIGQRMDRNGTLLTGAAGLVSATQVLASQVAEDLLGRLLTFCDPATAQIDPTTFGITELSFPEGIKAADVLTKLGLFESGYLWEILESNDAGKHRFNYRAWPTTPRYEVSVRDDWKQRGSDVDLCNRILVAWTDAVGNNQVTAVTAADLGLAGIGLPVDALGTRVKDADPITLPTGYGSLANATRIGGQILTDKINPPKAGTILVRRPIVDQLTGHTVMPWEIEPGYLCRVRETGDDLRITQVDYDDDSCSSLLTLGTPVLSDEQRLARLDRAATQLV
jgi:hypothetical protein